MSKWINPFTYRANSTLINFTVYNTFSFPPFLSWLTSSLMKFSMELMAPVSSVALLEKSVAPGPWLTVKGRFSRRQLMPRPSSAVLLSFTLEGMQAHPFRSSECCKKQVQTSPKQLCRTWIGKQNVQISANHPTITDDEMYRGQQRSWLYKYVGCFEFYEQA